MSGPLDTQRVVSQFLLDEGIDDGWDEDYATRVAGHIVSIVDAARAAAPPETLTTVEPGFESGVRAAAPPETVTMPRAELEALLTATRQEGIDYARTRAAAPPVVPHGQPGHNRFACDTCNPPSPAREAGLREAALAVWRKAKDIEHWRTDDEVADWLEPVLRAALLAEPAPLDVDGHTGEACEVCLSFGHRSCDGCGACNERRNRAIRAARLTNPKEAGS